MPDTRCEKMDGIIRINNSVHNSEQSNIQYDLRDKAQTKFKVAVRIGNFAVITDMRIVGSSPRDVPRSDEGEKMWSAHETDARTSIKTRAISREG